MHKIKSGLNTNWFRLKMMIVFTIIGGYLLSARGGFSLLPVHFPSFLILSFNTILILSLTLIAFAIQKGNRSALVTRLFLIPKKIIELPRAKSFKGFPRKKR